MPTLAEVLRQTGYSQDGTLVAPATDSPMTKALSEHIKTLPQQLATNQAALDSAIASWNKTDFATGKPNPNYRPEAIAELTQLMPNIGGLTAWHGTPHKIQGAFDISKVGTGEGAQAYGHGMYFAENPAVATEYKNILSKPEFTKNAEGIKLRGELPRMLEESYSELTAKNGIQQTNYGDVVDVVKQRLDRQMKDALKINDMDWYNKVADMKIDLARFKEKPPPNTGNLYKVDIPDEYIPNMLDWDKPLSAQPSIIEKLKSLGDAELSKLGINPDFTRRSTGKELTGESLYDVLTTHNSQKGASNLLAKLDIPGIRYLDQGSRPVAGGEIIDVFKTPEGWKSKIKVTNRNGMAFQVPSDMFTTSMPFKTEAEAKKWAQEKIDGGTSNFVVFDPSTVKILEENGKPLTRKELIEKQVKELKD